MIIQDNLRHDHQQQNFREDRRHPLSQQGDSSSSKEIKTKLKRGSIGGRLKSIWIFLNKANLLHRKLESHADISCLKSLPAKC